MPRPPKYTDEELLEDLRELADRLERHPPRKRDMDEYGSHGARSYQLRFGSWSEAVAAAGFEPREKGTDYEVRPDACPLCRTEDTGLDFHHWRYGENKTGCYLCRECHNKVHAGKAGRDNPNWLLYCINNLVELHVEYHDVESELNIDGIQKRYNLPENKDLVEAAIEK